MSPFFAIFTHSAPFTSRQTALIFYTFDKVLSDYLQNLVFSFIIKVYCWPFGIQT